MMEISIYQLINHLEVKQVVRQTVQQAVLQVLQPVLQPVLQQVVLQVVVVQQAVPHLIIALQKMDGLKQMPVRVLK